MISTRIPSKTNKRSTTDDYAVKINQNEAKSKLGENKIKITAEELSA